MLRSESTFFEIDNGFLIGARNHPSYTRNTPTAGLNPPDGHQGKKE
jgi:hypothetical protein